MGPFTNITQIIMLHVGLKVLCMHNTFQNRVDDMFKLNQCRLQVSRKDRSKVSLRVINKSMQ